MAQYNITTDSEILHYHFVKGAKDEKLSKSLERFCYLSNRCVANEAE